ncbi:MAG: type VI secretion system baseplate subunit TssG [Pseudomonadota bacterium]
MSADDRGDDQDADGQEPSSAVPATVIMLPPKQAGVEARMAAAAEARAAARLAGLAAEPWRYHLFVALRQIEAAAREKPRLGRSKRPRDDYVRLGQDPDMAFAPSTLRKFTLPKDGKPAALRNAFFGVFGSQGPLPLHLTEYARERVRNHRDTAFVGFADMLHHRMTSLFYRAWASAEPAPNFDRPDDDPFAMRLMALAGRLGEGFDDRDAMPDRAKLHYTAILAQTQRSEAGLARLVAGFFRAPVQIESFVGTWLHLEPDDRWALGDPNSGARLGGTTSLGGRVWSRQSKFRFKIGPLGIDDYQRLLPGGDSLAKLVAIVRNYVGDALEWEVNLVLRAEEVPKTRLGEAAGGGGRLGLTSWIGQRPAGRDADDLYLQPLGAA